MRFLLYLLLACNLHGQRLHWNASGNTMTFYWLAIPGNLYRLERMELTSTNWLGTAFVDGNYGSGPIIVSREMKGSYIYRLGLTGVFYE